MVTVEASYMEIYNERVRDLLDVTATRGGVPGSHAGMHPHGLKVREHPSVCVRQHAAWLCLHPSRLPARPA
jgi:hypothetical protein